MSETVNLKIEGGKKLSGEITTNRSKNAAVALLCASLINRGKTTLKNVPKIEEVARILEVLESLGVKITKSGNDLIIQPPTKFKLAEINTESASKTRNVLLMIGALVHHESRFKFPHPGGCKLGERTVRPHLFALEKLGVKIKSHETDYEVSATKLRPAEIVLYETGDTVTENALIAASLIPGQTTIKLASSNYMVRDLCYFLELLGVKIEGIGSSTLKITGLAKIERDVEFELSEDPIESMLFLAIAATTNSALTIKRCPIDFLELELLKLEKMGLKFKLSRRYKSANGQTDLVDITTKSSKLKALEDKIHPLPFPGLNIDNLPFFVPIATQARGTTLIHDWIYENRAIYYMELNKLGAKIMLADPHRVYIEGPSELRATEVVCPPALRPAAIILIAMLAARGTSILRNIYSINRGYEDLVTRLQKLGAKIEIMV
ncbi:MAG: UDP-N-acetylglucosamine 1-carboxyvinyltransferase [Patescibacteria group bacterium]